MSQAPVVQMEGDSAAAGAANPCSRGGASCRSTVCCSGETRCCALLGCKGEEGRDGDRLARFCEASWGTVHALVRGRGVRGADAEDLTQSYFARFIEKGWLHQTSAWRGCFRPFLVVSVRNFLANQWDRETALKRGGRRAIVPLDAPDCGAASRTQPVDPVTPEVILERRRAQEALQRGLERLAREAEAAGRTPRLRRLGDLVSQGAGSGEYRRVAREWGVREPAVRVAVHRLRRRLLEIVHEEVAGRRSHRRVGSRRDAPGRRLRVSFGGVADHRGRWQGPTAEDGER